MGKIDMRLYEFDAAFQAIQDEIESSIDYETGEWKGERTFEDIMLEQVNMEQGQKEKVLSVGRLILHYGSLEDAHNELKAKHAKKERAAAKAQELLKNYIKACVPEGFKAKDATVSIYEMKPERVQPLFPAEEMPPAFKRPILVTGYDRDLAMRIETGLAKQSLPSPFAWEHDKDALKKAAKECAENGTQFDLAKLEKGRSVVVR